jgi:hypothetical protein
MTKPPFKMPVRTETPAADVDRWVRGDEAPVAAPGSAPRAERPAGKLARLTIDLPPELHAKFKSTCALRGTRMIDEVRAFIEGWTQKHG